MPALRPTTLLACLLVAPATALAQAPDRAEERETSAAWSNATELSVVRTGGNAETQTFGFRNTVRRNWTSVRVLARVEGVRSRTAGERILAVAPGLQFRPGERPGDLETSIARRASASGVEQYFAGGRIRWQVGDRFFWNAGTSWDRNDEAGIRNRYVTFGGMGNTWADGEAASLSTSYGISFTAREDTEPDPARDSRFGGIRAGSDYHQQLGEAVELDSEATLNVNLLSLSDYSLNATHAVGVALSEHLSLRVSLQHLYEHEPALEDAAVVARVTLIDPDGRPGSGDELFETVAAGGAGLDFGTGRVRKRGLDVVLRTALVISF
ncbi:MAG: DUF481 domain-containing protein [Acidobacteria bacterium]|nr:DUF481 domain-containing protein [Acidobacteriota bacterium]